MRFCKIAITNSSQSFQNRLEDGLLSYSIPEEINEEVAVGSMVLVPFRNQKENGIVIDIYNSGQESHNFKVRNILETIYPDDFISQELIELTKFTADYYACNINEVCSAIFPSAIIKKPQKTIILEDSDTNYEHPILLQLKKNKKHSLSWARLKTLTNLKEADFKKEISKLKTKNLISIEYKKNKAKKTKTKNHLEKFQIETISQNFQFTQEQKQAIEVLNSFQGAHKFVLHGVTGSGKTEVYMNQIEKVLQAGESCIFLVPEISLAPQLAQRLAEKFGKEKIFIWHSALSTSEKKHSFEAIINEEPKIIIGARSAIFTPVKKLGLIVVDEEHENSYKQEEPNPRYHTHVVASKRAELNNCPIIFGSATPSVELFYKALSEEFPDFHLLTLAKRVFATAMPDVQIVDMREEFNNANKSIFSRSLKQKIEETLENQEQIILFLNKRGTASHVFCRNCGFVYNCSNCDSKTVYHQDKKKLICHYCGYSEEHPSLCPNCNSATIKFFGLGTQKLETETLKAFPQARVARLDSDNARLNNNYLEIWQDFKEKKIDILIGTQMIAKGLDLPDLNLVGVISADTNLSQLDFKADERAFQLLTQVSGRAGRRQKQGQVVFQSYQPKNETILFSKEHDYLNFYKKEIEIREALKYPPFASMIRFRAISENEFFAINTANLLHKKIFTVLEEHNVDIGQLSHEVDSSILKINAQKLVSIMGPCPSLIAKMNNKFRYHIVIKINNFKQAQALINALKNLFRNLEKQQATVTIDVDNVSLY